MICLLTLTLFRHLSLVSIASTTFKILILHVFMLYICSFGFLLLDSIIVTFMGVADPAVYFRLCTLIKIVSALAGGQYQRKGFSYCQLIVREFSVVGFSLG